MKVNLYDMFCTDTLRHRETARQIVEKLSRTPKTDLIMIDFDNIDFVSRSFLHELMKCLADRRVVFQNQNEEVEKMANLVAKSIEADNKEICVQTSASLF